MYIAEGTRTIDYIQTRHLTRESWAGMSDGAHGLLDVSSWSSKAWRRGRQVLQYVGTAAGPIAISIQPEQWRCFSEQQPHTAADMPFDIYHRL